MVIVIETSDGILDWWDISLQNSFYNNLVYALQKCLATEFNLWKIVKIKYHYRTYIVFRVYKSRTKVDHKLVTNISIISNVTFKYKQFKYDHVWHMKIYWFNFKLLRKI